MTLEVATLDMRQYVIGTAQDRDDFAAELVQQFHDIGFVHIQNHGVPQDAVLNLYEAARLFFNQDASVKARYTRPTCKNQVGYVAEETASGRTEPDRAEHWQFYPPDDTPARPMHLYLTPQQREISGFNEAGDEMSRHAQRFSMDMLKILARGFGEAETYYEERFRNGAAVLRTLNYLEDGFKNPHTDLCMMTTLYTLEPGTIVWPRGHAHEGERQPNGKVPMITEGPGIELKADPTGNTVTLNGGKILAFETSGYLMPSTHAVQAEAGRQSNVFFMNPAPDQLIKPVPKFTDVGYASYHAELEGMSWMPPKLPMQYQEYMEWRLSHNFHEVKYHGQSNVAGAPTAA